MKKIITLLLSLLLIFSFSAVYAEDVILISPAPGNHPPRLVDEADLVGEGDEYYLTKMLDEVSTKHAVDVVIVTVDSTGEKTPMEYADDYFDYNGYGFGENYDGILLLISMEYSDWWISTCGYGIIAFTDAGIEYIGEKIVPYMSNGNFYTAFKTYVEYCDEFITLAENGDPFDVEDIPKEPFDPVKAFIISLVAGFGIAFVVMLVLKGQLKSVRMQAASGDYIVPGSMTLNYARDFFITSHTSRRAKPQESSGGSSTHTSSSGRSHGGGGGKF